MTDRPILFSAPMVRALLDGRKTQTRRILKPQPGPCTHKPYDKGMAEFQPSVDEDGLHCAECGNGLRIANTKSGVRGIPLRFRKGDRLWVRETWWHHKAQYLEQAGFGGGTVCLLDGSRPAAFHPNPGFDPSAHPAIWRKRPGIHMPRWASRLTLTVTDVRVQRLSECSEADALAEGVVKASDGRFIVPGVDHPNRLFGELSRVTAREMYAALWDVINGSGSWLASPWIVALTFTAERRNIDAARAA